jgi:hypothetical protein
MRHPLPSHRCLLWWHVRSLICSPTSSPYGGFVVASVVIVGSSIPPYGGFVSPGHWHKGVLQGKAAWSWCFGGVSKGSHFCVFPSKCLAGSKVSWRDLRASRSSSSPPQQGGLKVAHAVPKVVFLAFLAWWHFLQFSLHCCYSSRLLQRVTRIPPVCPAQGCGGSFRLR